MKSLGGVSPGRGWGKEPNGRLRQGVVQGCSKEFESEADFSCLAWNPDQKEGLCSPTANEESGVKATGDKGCVIFLGLKTYPVVIRYCLVGLCPLQKGGTRCELAGGKRLEKKQTPAGHEWLSVPCG